MVYPSKPAVDTCWRAPLPVPAVRGAIGRQGR